MIAARLRSRLASLWTKASSPVRSELYDFVAVGYPKTGNTWTRVMLGRYVERAYGLSFMPLFDPGEREDLRKVGYRGPFGTFTHAPLTFERQTADDLSYENVIAPFENRRVVLLVRHPLDVMVSAYMQAVHRAKDPFAGTLADFVDDSVRGLGPFFAYYQLWDRYKNVPGRLLRWRYEDVRQAPAARLTELVGFLGMALKPELIEDAVEYSSFERMKAMERSSRTPVYRSSQLPIFATGDRSNCDAYHVRRGESGSYREEMELTLAQTLERRIEEDMPAWYQYGK